MIPTELLWHGVRAKTLGARADASAPHELLRAPQVLLVGAEGLELLPAYAKTVPLVAVGFDASARLMPHLIDVQSQTEAVQSSILESLGASMSERESPYCAMLETEGCISSLIRHLCHQQRILHEGKVAWLRLHDPYVMAHLPRSVGAAGMRRIMGPVNRWQLRLGDQWLTFNCASAMVSDAPAATDQPKLEAWHRLTRIGAVNRALALCGQLHLDGIRRHAEHLDALVARASERLHLEEPKDQAQYAQMGLHLDLQYDEHPLIAQECGDADDVPADRVQRLAALPADVWIRLARECPRRDAQLSTGPERTA